MSSKIELVQSMFKDIINHVVFFKICAVKELKKKFFQLVFFLVPQRLKSISQLQLNALMNECDSDAILIQ